MPNTIKSTVHKVEGIRLSALESGIRYANRLDLVLVEISEQANVAAVFTQNAFCAAPVIVARDHLGKRASRYFLINTGNANAGTGSQGVADSIQCCQMIAEHAGVTLEEVLPFSTGVIGERLPTAPISASVAQAFENLSEDNWLDAANGILTTDTRPKLASTQIDLDGQLVNITGMAKGSGMIKPNMATMLAFLFTDAQIDQKVLSGMLNQCVEKSFNRITVDGDTSTNDSCLLVATGKSGAVIDESTSLANTKFREALESLFVQLATDLIKDAEGATKFVSIRVKGGASVGECLSVAYTVAESPLVKTALFASDPNWGRILAAVGRSDIEKMDLKAVSILLGDTPLVTAGEPDSEYTEKRGQIEMDKQDIAIEIDLSRGEFSETVWTSDLSHDYVRINSEYRS